MNSKFFSRLFVFFIAIVSIALFFIIRNNNEKSLSCHGTMTQSFLSEDVKIEAYFNHSIFEDNNAGYDTVLGKITLNNQTYSISRILDYKINRQSTSYRTITMRSIKKTKNDNFPDELAQVYFPYLTDFEEGFIKLKNLADDILLITNPAGPIVVCYIDKDF